MRLIPVYYSVVALLALCLTNSSDGKGGRGGGGRGNTGGSKGAGSGSGSHSGTGTGGGAWGGKGWSLFNRKSSISSSITSSSEFRTFAAGAKVAYIVGKKGRRKKRKYYFAPIGYHHKTDFMRDDNVCYADVLLSQLSSSTPRREVTIDIYGRTRVYFLCDGSCCGTDCCELNTGLLVFIIVMSILGFCCFCAFIWWIIKQHRCSEKKTRPPPVSYNPHFENVLPNAPAASFSRDYKPSTITSTTSTRSYTGHTNV